MLETLMMVLGMVDLDSVLKMLVDNGIFATLFGYMLWDTRRDAKGREDRLVKHIDRQDETMDKISISISRIDSRLHNLEKEKKKKEIK